LRYERTSKSSIEQQLYISGGESGMTVIGELDCCVSSTNAFPWNISIQFPFMDISIGAGTEFGSALVPDVAGPVKEFKRMSR
jgi:hypothetical protein